MASEVASRSARRTARASAVAEEHVRGGARNAARTGDERARRDGRARGRGRPRPTGANARRDAPASDGGGAREAIDREGRLWRAASKWRGGDPLGAADHSRERSHQRHRQTVFEEIAGRSNRVRDFFTACSRVVGLRVDFAPPPRPPPHSTPRCRAGRSSRVSPARARARRLPRRAASLPARPRGRRSSRATPGGRRHLAPLRASSELAHRPRGRSRIPRASPSRPAAAVPPRARLGVDALARPPRPRRAPPRFVAGRSTFGVGRAFFRDRDPARIPRRVAIRARGGEAPPFGSHQGGGFGGVARLLLRLLLRIPLGRLGLGRRPPRVSSAPPPGRRVRRARVARRRRRRSRQLRHLRV